MDQHSLLVLLQNHFFRMGSLRKQLTWWHEIVECHTFRPQATAEGILGKEYSRRLVPWSMGVRCMILEVALQCKTPPTFHTLNHSTNPSRNGTVKELTSLSPTRPLHSNGTIRLDPSVVHQALSATFECFCSTHPGFSLTAHQQPTSEAIPSSSWHSMPLQLVLGLGYAAEATPRRYK